MPVCPCASVWYEPSHQQMAAPPADERTTRLSVTFNDPLWLPQISEPACHPFPIRESLLGPAASHDRWRTSVVRLKWDLNQWPFGLGDQALGSWQQSPLSDASRAGQWETGAARAKLVITAKKKRRGGRGRGLCTHIHTHTHTHTHTSAMYEKVLCKSRLQLLLYKVLTSARHGEELALWWTMLRLSVRSALFMTVIGTDWIVKVCYWCLCVWERTCGRYEQKPRESCDLDCLTLDLWPLTWTTPS